MNNKELMSLVRAVNDISNAMINPALKIIDFNCEWEFEAEEVKLLDNVNVQSLTGKRKVNLEITFDEVD